MKKLLLVVAFLSVFLTLSACSSSKEPSEQVEEVVLFGTEDDVAYYDVYFADDLDWNDLSEEEKSGIAVYAINECLTKASDLQVDSVMVIGYDHNGNNAFSWGGIGGTKEIRYYIDGVYSYNGDFPTEE